MTENARKTEHGQTVASLPKQKKSPLRWILPCGAVLAALAAAAAFFLPSGKEPQEERIIQVHCAADAIEFLESRGEDLGYENALSELTELHCATVDGDSYYRLQQNYKGIPVYGRTVVYAADGNGNQLAVTQNIQDVPGGLNLTPTVSLWEARYCLLMYLAEVNPEGPWAEYLDKEDMTCLPEFTLDEENLCIYTLGESAHLAYQVHIENLFILFDAHTGQVLQLADTMQYAGAWSYLNGSDIGFQSLPMEDGTYVLKDVDEGIYVYDANNQTFWIGEWAPLTNIGFRLFRPENLTLIRSSDRIFGDDNDNSPNSPVAAEALSLVKRIRGFYRDTLGEPAFSNEMVLVVNDKVAMGGGNAGGGGVNVSNWDPELIPENNAAATGNYMALLTLGYDFCENLMDNLDVIAHEYTHIVTACRVGWSGTNRENQILNEAFSDIFGELVECYITGSLAPDWSNSVRESMSDPRSAGYPAHVNDPLNVFPEPDESHGYSTVISHAAYLMWNGIDGTEESRISTEDLAELWYRAMLMMPKDAQFKDCRNVIELAAENMGLSEAQKQCIAEAFDTVGIPNRAAEADVDYQVEQVFEVFIFDADKELADNCQVVIRKAGAAYGPNLPTDAPIVWTSGDSERCYMKLDPGFYTMTVTVHGQPETTETYEIQVMSDASGEKEIKLYMNQGKVMADIGVHSASGGKTPLAGAAIQVYREQYNEPVFFGQLNGNGDDLRLYLEPDKYVIIATAQGCKSDRITMDMTDTTVRYSHSFLLEENEMEDPEAWFIPPEQITGGAPYEVLTWERSFTGETDGVTWTNRYSCSYIQLLGDDPAYALINRQLYEIASEAMNSIDDESLYEPQYDYRGICENYGWSMAAQVVHNGNGIICVLLNQNQAVTYSLYNGAQLGLYILAGDREEAYLRKLNSFYDRNHWQAAELGDFNPGFAVMDGEIVLLGGSEMIYTGLYVSTDYTDRLQGTMRATGGTGSAEYEILEWDRSFRRLGAPGCNQDFRYVCKYPALSGTPACGQINQELYDLAEQFMTGIPEELTYTSNKFYYDVTCNTLFGENAYRNYYVRDGVMYNKNGMMSYLIDWDVELSHFHNGQTPYGYELYSGYHGIVYDLETGAHLSLQQITGMDEKTQLLMLKDAFHRVTNTSNLRMVMDLGENPDTINLADPKFLLNHHGQILLVYSRTKDISPEIREVYPIYEYEREEVLPTGLYLLDP